jgi:hypothetical protein
VSLKRRRSVWRSVVLRGDQTLDDLHQVIFTAFERYDDHLYSFYFPSASSRRSHLGKRAKEYTAPQGFEPCEPFGNDNRYNAADAVLDGLKLRADQTFEYLFDFGDQWWHEIKVEAIDSIESGRECPQIIDRRGSSPPQYPESEE